MPPPQTIVFDLGEVLIRWDPRRIYRDHFGADTAAMEHFLAEICAPEWNRAIDAGKSFDAAVAERQALFPEQAALIALWRDEWSKSLNGAVEGSVAILSELRAQGRPLYALTNWSAETFPIARERFAFLDWFRDIVVSGEVGLAKPDPAIFALFLARTGVTAKDAVFIDDSPANVSAAAEAGFHAVRFTTPRALRTDLAALGVLSVPPR